MSRNGQPPTNDGNPRPPEPNFFLINRSLLDHPWLKKNRSWQLAWIYIIGRANYQTGQVNLTEIYREIDDMLDYHQWRYFLQKLVKEGMLVNVTAANKGRTLGYQQAAQIANYEKYQGEKPNGKPSEKSQSKSQSTSHSNSHSPIPSQTQEPGASRSASLSGFSEQVAVSYKEDTSSLRSEVSKKKKPSLSQTANEVRARDPFTPERGSGGIQGLQNQNPLHTLKQQHPDLFAAFKRIAKVKRYAYDAQLEQATGLLEAAEKHGATTLAAALGAALAVIADLDMPLLYAYKQLPTTSNANARSTGPPPLSAHAERLVRAAKLIQEGDPDAGLELLN